MSAQMQGLAFITTLSNKLPCYDRRVSVYAGFYVFSRDGLPNDVSRI